MCVYILSVQPITHLDTLNPVSRTDTNTTVVSVLNTPYHCRLPTCPQSRWMGPW
jgi:hypothetical protein